MTAAVTGATTITGTVHGIGGIKVGNEVSAQITGTASHLTATAIQDPADNSGTWLTPGSLSAAVGPSGDTYARYGARACCSAHGR